MLRTLFQRKRRSLSLVPLIDVVFILLLFFMLSTTLLLENELQVHFSQGGETNDNLATRVILLKSNDGIVYLDDQRFSYFSHFDMNELKKKVGSDAVTIDIAPDVRIQPFISFLDRLKQFGFNNVSLLEESD